MKCLNSSFEFKLYKAILKTLFKTEKIQSLREIDDIVMLQAMGDACYGDAGGSVWKWMMQRSDTTLITTIMIIMGQKSKLGPRLLVGSP